nr:basic salivary proline-rich protein 2-like [Dasypus novemcinctus]
MTGEQRELPLSGGGSRNSAPSRGSQQAPTARPDPLGTRAPSAAHPADAGLGDARSQEPVLSRGVPNLPSPRACQSSRGRPRGPAPLGTVASPEPRGVSLWPASRRLHAPQRRWSADPGAWRSQGRGQGAGARLHRVDPAPGYPAWARAQDAEGPGARKPALREERLWARESPGRRSVDGGLAWAQPAGRCGTSVPGLDPLVREPNPPPCPVLQTRVRPTSRSPSRGIRVPGPNFLYPSPARGPQTGSACPPAGLPPFPLPALRPLLKRSWFLARSLPPGHSPSEGLLNPLRLGGKSCYLILPDFPETSGSIWSQEPDSREAGPGDRAGTFQRAPPPLLAAQVPGPQRPLAKQGQEESGGGEVAGRGRGHAPQRVRANAGTQRTGPGWGSYGCGRCWRAPQDPGTLSL